MNEIRALIEELVARGVDVMDAAEIVSRAAIAGAAKAPRRTSSGAERQARYMARKKLAEAQATAGENDESVSNDVTMTENDALAVLSPEKRSPTPPKKTNPKPIPPSPPKGGSSPREFDQFWETYPHKVGKRDAEAAFVKARRRVTFDALMTGLHRYVAKADDRPWCNPSTWLNQDRWDDAPAQQPRGSPPSGNDRPMRGSNLFFASAAQDIADEQRRSGQGQGFYRDDDGGVSVLTIEHHRADG